MRTVIVFNMITVDGYFEGLDHELGWHNVNAEFNEFAISQLEETDTLVFGQNTYDLMSSFWPTEDAQKGDPIVAAKMNSTAKLVFSNTIEEASWQNTTVVNGDVMGKFRAIKAQNGKNLLVLGSSKLCVSLLQEHLIDEIRLMVNPVILGTGNTLFAGIKDIEHLQLLDTRTFESGNILLRYTTQKWQ